MDDSKNPREYTAHAVRHDPHERYAIRTCGLVECIRCSPVNCRTNTNSHGCERHGEQPMQRAPQLVRSQPDQGQNVESQPTRPSPTPPRKQGDTEEDGRDGGEE